ncbi:MAG: alpha-ketoacid dehydrogenase subunit beta [Microbacteriaceae bacterium]|nr:MAG: alpha-ketoacid dehydrogenase subunit beta [Microbacteriaceae bacterium]
MTEMTILDAVRTTLAYEMARDERVMVLGEDVGVLGGVFRATAGLLDEFGGDRVIDMPISEGAIIGSALGLSISGLRPVAELQFLGFGAQAFHQITQQVARYRFRSQGRFSPALTIRAPFGGGVRTPEMHSDALEAQYVQSPGLKVVAPSTPSDTKGLLLQAIRDEDPVLFLEPLRGYRLVRGDVPEGEHLVDFGKVRIAREGRDVTVIAWSAAVQLAEKAAEELEAEGISVRVIDLRTLVPFDVEGVVENVIATGRCVIVHEAPLSAGFGAEVVATIQEEAFYDLRAPVLRVCAPDAPYPVPGIEQYYLPNVARVKNAVRRTVEALT